MRRHGQAYFRRSPQPDHINRHRCCYPHSSGSRTRFARSAYFECLCFELVSAGLRIEAQKILPLVYRDVLVRRAYRADVIVEEAVVLEVKALDKIAPIHSRQLYTYLRVADCRVGLVLNFGAPIMLDGIKRVVNNFPEDS
jgi:GxxExxY protein